MSINPSHLKDCETFQLTNSIAVIWYTGQHYRARLDMNRETSKALHTRTDKLNLSVTGDTQEEALERAKRADEILGKLKEAKK